ncbi:MAG: hypothetical protein L0Z50_39650 [Verrucomicrobiales bacterium]|nr:hypothetical protein [Verrucomicrobiales bacterium]
MSHETFQAGDLTAVIGDNAAYADRRPGYNGLHRLVHRTKPDPSLFGIAGLNLEHIFDGDKDLLDLAGDRKVFFEPRHHPMELRKLSPLEAELYQSPTPTFFLESWTRFKLAPPHAIDFTFRCQAHQHVFRHGYIGLFWASYINAPENKSVYFKDPKGWVQLCTQEHNNQSTVRHVDDKRELAFIPVREQTLYKNFSPLRFAEPFFYGYFGAAHVFVLMFDRAEGIRFSHSPSSGGAPSFPNPAWDFQFIIPQYEVLQNYGFRARAVYRERCSREEIEREYRTWRATL